MAVVATPVNKSLALVDYVYNVTGLVNGANTVTLPAPPTAGSFPPAGDWTPTTILCFPYNPGSQGNLVTPDLTTIVNSTGTITFTVYAGGATSCLMFVY